MYMYIYQKRERENKYLFVPVSADCDRKKKQRLYKQSTHNSQPKTLMREKLMLVSIIQLPLVI